MNQETTINPETEHSPTAVLQVWFGDAETGRLDLPQVKRWFMGGKAFDDELSTRFGATLAQARTGKLDHWQNSAHDALALIVLLDQFNRNIHRSTAEAFAGDAQALDLSKLCLDRQYDQRLSITQRVFCYLPFEHDESEQSQIQSVALFEHLLEEAPAELKDFSNRALESALEHKAIVDKFGRYPYRNEVLGRTSTPEEQQWLAESNKRFGQ